MFPRVRGLDVVPADAMFTDRLVEAMEAAVRRAQEQSGIQVLYASFGTEEGLGSEPLSWCRWIANELEGRFPGGVRMIPSDTLEPEGARVCW